MLNAVITAFKELQLELALEKIKCTAEMHGVCEDGFFCVNGRVVEKVESIVVLGSRVCHRGEEKSLFEHTISAGWTCYKK